MKTKILFFLLIFSKNSIAQKDCNIPTRNFVPLIELGNSTFNGYKGGLYPNGSNNLPLSYLQNALIKCNEIKPLNTSGNIDVNGKIIIIGVGASNPRTEFLAFQNMTDTFQNINPNIALINTCIGGQGIQKMNDPNDNYWKQAVKTFDSLSSNFLQVQAAWIETENTQSSDTLFPRAPISYLEDLRTLLITLKLKFPNLKFCYLSARAYSGWVSLGSTGKGLLAPRDYYNGWSNKWLIDSAINNKQRFTYQGANPIIPMPIYATYFYTNGENIRNDGFSFDCDTDIGNDGLHLSAQGEIKLGKLIFDYFKTNETTKSWFLKQNSSEINGIEKNENLKIFPNPTNGMVKIECNEMSNIHFKLYDILGKEIEINRIENQNYITFDISNLKSGIYFIEVKTLKNNFNIKIIKT